MIPWMLQAHSHSSGTVSYTHLVGVYAKHCGYKFSSGQLTLALIGTALVVTALNTGAMYIDSVRCV